jgi:hypothetical protein
MRTSQNPQNTNFAISAFSEVHQKLALMLVDTEPTEAVRCGIPSPRLPE